MGAEYLLYGYGIVCLSMLVFNIIYCIYLNSGQRRLERKVERISSMADSQFRLIRDGLPISSGHISQMERYLSRVGNLLAFDQFLDQKTAQNVDIRAYLSQLRPAFLALARVYQNREDTQAAYYCHFLTRHLVGQYTQMEPLHQELLAYLDKRSIYCRVNTLKALCAFGCVESVVQALLRLRDLPGAGLHNKILVETLLTFQGDSAALIVEIWQRFEQFPTGTQRALLDYIRFKSGDYCEQMLRILTDTDRDKELRLAAIRYLGKYPYPLAHGALVELVAQPDSRNWEFTAIAASSLAGYQGADVVDALSQAMHNSNWYVRYNAAVSLEALGLTYEQLLHIAGNDRFAREMLVYRLESREMAESQERMEEGKEAAVSV